MIYLREEGGPYVGPFRSREEAKRFIKLMELCGENWSETEIVDTEAPDSTTEQIERIQ